MTRQEAETRILEHLEQVQAIINEYHPENHGMMFYVDSRYISGDNDLSLGGKDHDHPISIKHWKKEDE